MTTSDLTPASNRIVNILGGISADSRDCDMAAYALFCPDPPQTEYWPVTDMLRIISEDPDCSSLSEGNNCKLLIVSINPYFQFPVFTYHLTQDFPELVLEIQGVVKTIVNVDDLLEFQYIIYQDIPSKGKGWYNKVLLDILQTKDTLFSESHQRIAELNLPDDTRAILIKRTKPLEYLEAVQVLKSIDFPDPEMYRYFEVALLPPLAINEGKTEDASLLCSEALTFSKTSTLLVVFDYMMYADLGWTHYLCGNLDAATDAYNHALGIYELDERSHYGLGLIFDAQNQIDRAHKEFELTIQCDPNSHYAFLAREWLDQNK